MIYIYIVLFLFISTVSILWVFAIDEMKEKYPDYKGEDLFDDDDQSK